MSPAIARRVARRVVARDFPSEKALEKYLRDHPNADRKKHQVADHDEKGSEGESDHGDRDDDHDDEGMLSRLKGALKGLASKLKGAPKDVQKFVADPKHRKEALGKGVQAMKKAPRKYFSQLAKVAKHEVHEFKTAGQGLKAVMSGDKPSAEQKKAIKAVAVHMGITVAAAVLTTATPALATMAVGKAMGKHMALKAALKVLGDLHVLEEVGHIGHGVGHVLQTLTKFAAEEDDDEKASPEELLAALVMKHLGELMQDIDDDTLAEAMGADGYDDDGDEGQKKQAARVAARYLARQVRGTRPKTARPMMSPWGGEDHAWPAVPPLWDEEGVQRDRFRDVHVMRYVAYGHAGSPMLTVDTTPWIHNQKPEFTYTIHAFDQKVDSGKFPVDAYERKIPELLKKTLDAAQQEVAKYVKQLEQLKVPNWDIHYDKHSDDMVVEYQDPKLSEYSDSNMSGSFYSPLKIFTGEKSDYDISYSKGADYEGHFGVRKLHGEVRSLEDVKKVLKDAERLWAKAEKRPAN